MIGNPALVRFVARQFDDIEQLGFVRLFRTIERFDPKRRSLEEE
jgi:DNA-directed RNA polymerase specialized sigma subunit